MQMDFRHCASSAKSREDQLAMAGVAAIDNRTWSSEAASSRGHVREGNRLCRGAPDGLSGRATGIALFFFLAAPLLAQAPGANPSGPQAKPVTVVLETELGNITIQVDTVRAPITSANFLRYVDGGFYNGGAFHRTVRPDTEVRTDYPIQEIQAEINLARANETFPPIPLERTSVTGLRHLDGIVSMARDLTKADTATTEFFICIGDQPSLDYHGGRSTDNQGFAAFGKVIEGMDVVKKIQMSPAPKDTPAQQWARRGQSLVPKIRIIRAYRK
jgi:peptidyl-prolyl cis-trans isomerase A (cyclophilin A)